MSDDRKLTRTERTLHDGAEAHWPGTGDDLVVVYRAFSPDRMLALWAAMTLTILVGEPLRRDEILRSLEARVPRPKTERATAKKERADAALAALTRLRRRMDGLEQEDDIGEEG